MIECRATATSPRMRMARSSRMALPNFQGLEICRIWKPRLEEALAEKAEANKVAAGEAYGRGQNVTEKVLTISSKPIEAAAVLENELQERAAENVVAARPAAFGDATRPLPPVATVTPAARVSPASGFHSTAAPTYRPAAGRRVRPRSAVAKACLARWCLTVQRHYGARTGACCQGGDFLAAHTLARQQH
jgi:hypothetical protein